MADINENEEKDIITDKKIKSDKKEKKKKK